MSLRARILNGYLRAIEKPAIRRIARESKDPSECVETLCTGPKGEERAVRYGYPSLNGGIEVALTERAQPEHWIAQIYAAPRA